MVDIVRDPEIPPGSLDLESVGDITITGHSRYIDATQDDIRIRRVDTFTPGDSTRISTFLCRFASETPVTGTETILVSENFDFDISDARAVAYVLIPVTTGTDVVVGKDDRDEKTVYELLRVVGEEPLGQITVTVPNENDEGGDDGQ